MLAFSRSLAIGGALARWLLLPLIVLVALQSAAAAAERRVALVIGNGAYANVGALPNPTRDAAAIAAMLKAAGFDTIQRTDLGAQAMRRALRDFSDTARDADMAVVFFAGHGIEVSGTNYLLPVDAVLDRDLDVEDEGVSLDRINQVLGQTRRLRLIILDACRDNPFLRQMKRTVASRSVGRGLAQIEVLTSDTLVAYAAKAGSTAADGDGANSPYTTALLKHLATPGLDVRLALGRVRDEVLQTTSRKQEPFVYGSLGGAEVTLVPASAAAPAGKATRSATSTPEAAAREWQDVKEVPSVRAIEGYLERHGGDPVYAVLARERLAALKQQQQEASQRAALETEGAAAERNGDSGAMVRVGYRYSTGDGVPVDHVKARDWYEKAASRGNAPAMHNLGILYMNGHGVTRDFIKAKEWHEKAVAAGHNRALYDLGILYDRGGPGLAQDFAKALDWYTQSAAKDDARAMNNIGIMHYNGRGVPKDAAKAKEWYLKAASKNHAIAMFNIANNLERGNGEPVDCVAALDWYRKSATAGYEPAKARIETLSKTCKR